MSRSARRWHGRRSGIVPKAVRSLSGQDGTFLRHGGQRDKRRRACASVWWADYRRMWSLFRRFAAAGASETIHYLTNIDPWFLRSLGHRRAVAMPTW